MDEGVVEGGEDTGYAEDELACEFVSVVCVPSGQWRCGGGLDSPSRT